MPISPDITFTWLGHGTWSVVSATGKKVLIDPWVMGNPACPEGLKQIDELDLMLITHGHFDHIADAVEIAKRTSPQIVGIVELTSWLAAKGVTGASDHAMNKGGTVVVEGISVTMVHAEHSCGITDNGQVIYGGEAVGYVIEFENGYTIYFSGDTDVFGDMALIGRLHRLDSVFLPIGGHYTMDVRRAAHAVELLGARVVVPMHYNTFPLLSANAADLAEQLGNRARVVSCAPGQTL